MLLKKSTLSLQQVAGIQDSFARIASKSDQFAAQFYEALFRAHPAVRPLFPADMAAQRDKLVATLAFVVRGLGNFSSIEKAVRDLGVRHRGYKAEPAHYDAVGVALLETLQGMLGPRWTPELKDAWTAAYKLLAAVMMDAASKRQTA